MNEQREAIMNQTRLGYGYLDAVKEVMRGKYDKYLTNYFLKNI